MGYRQIIIGILKWIRKSDVNNMDNMHNMNICLEQKNIIILVHVPITEFVSEEGQQLSR